MAEPTQSSGERTRRFCPYQGASFRRFIARLYTKTDFFVPSDIYRPAKITRRTKNTRRNGRGRPSCIGTYYVRGTVYATFDLRASVVRRICCIWNTDGFRTPGDFQSSVDRPITIARARPLAINGASYLLPRRSVPRGRTTTTNCRT